MKPPYGGPILFYFNQDKSNESLFEIKGRISHYIELIYSAFNIVWGNT
jgi:hypothetical protein